MGKTAFVTGCAGQDGAYLSKLLLKKGYKVIGGYRYSSTLNFWRLEALGIKNDIELVPFELASNYSIKNTIKKYRDIDEFYNLGATCQVWIGEYTPDYVNKTNYEAVKKILTDLSQDVKFFQASTSSLYEDNKDSYPQDESTLFVPRSAYAQSKYFAHSDVVFASENAFRCAGILFNHESPLKDKSYLFTKVTQTLRDIFEKKKGVLDIGYMYVKKDYSFAGDIVEGIYKMMQYETPEVFCLGSGESYTVKEIIERTWKILSGREIIWQGEGIDEVGIDSVIGKIVTVNPKYYRVVDALGLKADITKAKDLLGWQPKYNLDKFIKLMINDKV